MVVTPRPVVVVVVRDSHANTMPKAHEYQRLSHFVVLESFSLLLLLLRIVA